ncbi:hypothetical protein Tco_0649176 [Tanacetum coccineum]
MQQPMPNPEDITDPTTAMNMALALMAKAFKLNYSTPTNNNQRISSNPRNRQIAQPGMNMGQDRQMRMVGANGGNQFRQYAGQNVGYQNGYNAVQNVGNQVVQDAVQNQGVQNIGNQNGQIGVQNIGNGNVVAARAEGNAPGNNGFSKSLTESLLKSRDFISKIGSLRRRKEMVHELGHKIVPSCDRIWRFFFKPSPGCSFERKWKQHQLNNIGWNLIKFHRLSYFRKTSNMRMRIVILKTVKRDSGY